MIAHKVAYSNFVDPEVAQAQLGKNRETWTAAKKQIDAAIGETSQVEWDSKTAWFEMSKFLAKKLRGTLGIPADASNAFFKAVELFKFVKPAQPVRLFDNASLPGDFIRAAKWMWGETVDWRANSLIGGLDDRYGLMRDNPEKWLMSNDMNGDVTLEKNLDEIEKRLGSWRPTVYTSDLGFGPSDYYKEEEEHFAAHRGQVMLGLRILEQNGTLIVKTFTMFNPETIDLLCHLLQNFTDFWIVKPCTSKADNSECYWVGTGYRRNSNIRTLGGSYPRSVINIATALILRQSAKIQSNVTLFRQRKRVDSSKPVDNWIVHNLLDC